MCLCVCDCVRERERERKRERESLGVSLVEAECVQRENEENGRKKIVFIRKK